MRRPWLRSLVPLYAAGLALKNRLVRGRRLRGKVVSVGSLSAGGAGKTPVAMMVVTMLREAGFAVDLLSRGYGRSGKGVERVDLGGAAERFGDEPMMMARRLGVPVWVGPDRFQAGLAAEDVSGAPEHLVHVLDDGFQHRRLARDVDVVVLTAEDAQDSLLPGGNLREPLAALERADVIVLREEEAEALRGLVPSGKAVWVVRRELCFTRNVPAKVVVFCGIARAAGFIEMLAQKGIIGAGEVRFKDHHPYGMRDATVLAGMARLARAGGFVTTEKDAVKLTGEMRAVLEEVGPVLVAELHVDLIEGSVNDLLGRLR